MSDVLPALARVVVAGPGNHGGVGEPSASGDGRALAWQSLAALMDAEFPPESDAFTAWSRVIARPDDSTSLQAFAELLVATATVRPRFLAQIRFWLASAQANLSESEQVNVISGGAQVYGPSIQAGNVHGGIHVHTPAPHQPRPRQLLPVTAHFTGRDGDLTALRQLLARKPVHSSALIVVTGPAGVGKTTMASAWLREVGESFPDGHLYVDLRGFAAGGPASSGEVLGRLLQGFVAGPVPADAGERASLWRTVTDKLKAVILLDNAFSAAQVRPLLPGGAGSLVVVTSRRRLSGLSIDGAGSHRLDVLNVDTSLDLLAQTISQSRVDREPQSARDLVNLCAGLPLALSLVAARLASRPRLHLQSMVDVLAGESGRLAALELEGDAVVRHALDASYEALPPGAARLYRRLGLLPVPTYDLRVAAAVLTEPLLQTERALDELIEANLLEDIGPDTFRFHDLVGSHARERGTAEETPAGCAEVLRRLCDWYLSTATAAEQRLTPAQFVLPRTYVYRTEVPLPFSTDSQALTWLDDHRMNLMSVVRTAAQQGWDDTTWQLVDAMWPLFLRLRYYDLWIEAHELGLAAAQSCGNGEAERQMLNSGAIGLGAARRLDDASAWYRRSAEAARQAGDVRDEGQALLGLGSCHHEAGRAEEATARLTEAITVWRECGYLRGVALAMVVLGEVSLKGGDAGAAVAHFERARDILAEVQDPHDEARALAFLGNARVHAGRYTAGMAELEQALAVFSAAGSTHWQARTLEMLGQNAEAADDRDRAVGCYTRALELQETISRDDAARVRGRLEGLRPASAGPSSADPR